MINDIDVVTWATSQRIDAPFAVQAIVAFIALDVVVEAIADALNVIVANQREIQVCD